MSRESHPAACESAGPTESLLFNFEEWRPFCPANGNLAGLASGRECA